MQTNNYQVIVGNIGTVYDGSTEQDASEAYAEYVRQSLKGYGRVGGESVTLLLNGEPVKELSYGEDYNDE